MVKKILDDRNLKYASIMLGEIDFGDYHGNKLDIDIISSLADDLNTVGFSILNDTKSKLIESIKRSCLDYIQQYDPLNSNVLSEYLSHSVSREYNYLSNLFSATEGITIEQHFIQLRIEKVKELLIYGEMSLGEVAFQLGFSSVAHLSGQFKKITGLTPSYFRALRSQKMRTSLDKL
ncbi:helix-turn-helix domain-containing protein [Thalassotalea crassostreae]|uniref:helix-turn-helix domain-containing protein n=1 Tax=Thalassotalea crassostreae TaxID=1763536 RepID=UPI000AEAB96C|nr:helix-turn-helix transcriptional regulator [Thalassotalea crassostreae]